MISLFDKKVIASVLKHGEFAKILSHWSSANQRSLPWKKDNDPYKIWISEIILQQTRVSQGTPYFLRFIEAFPNIQALASASEDEVLKLWQGLGYYTRARNLHASSKYIVEKYSGIFPNTYTEIIQLKGIGSYTAAAIASFAFEQKHAVVDGNVLRFITRLLGTKEAIDKPQVKKLITDFVNQAIQTTLPSTFNQALMDFGSMVCTVSKPSCHTCPFSKDCIAFLHDEENIIPFKTKKKAKKDRYFHYFDLRFPDNMTLIFQQKSDDIWKKLYLLPYIEAQTGNVPEMGIIKKFIEDQLGYFMDYDLKFISVKNDVQLLTHQKIHGFFYEINIEKLPHKINQDHYLVERSKVSTFAYPKIITKYLEYTII